MLFDRPIAPDPAKGPIRSAHRLDERAALLPLLGSAELSPADSEHVLSAARARATRARELPASESGIEAFMREYDLSSEEGVLLMCLAEALLRIPDSATQEALIRDKLARGDWSEHLGRSHSLFVNASTWGLIISGRLVALDTALAPVALPPSPAPPPQGGRGLEIKRGEGVLNVLQRLAARLGEKVARVAIGRAMGVLAEHFVTGSTIEDALQRAEREPGVRYSYDCLGEAARCARDVEVYFAAYRHAINTIGAQAHSTGSVVERPGISGSVFERPGVSVKLSALHPRYEYAKRERVLAELTPRVLALAQAARAANVGITLDAEEAERLELSLDIFEAVYRHPSMRGWEEVGLAVQAYQRRAAAVLEWLASLARVEQRRVPLRLVKGAYWDSEIKRAQQLGLDDYPEFATHNAYTVSYLLAVAGDAPFEFQRLHGMGGALYQTLAEEGVAAPCRVYAPVGSHETLLPYLVRRLLENGANTSFVNQLADARVPVERLVVDPVAAIKAVDATPHPRIPAPPYIYGAERRNSRGLDLSDPEELARLDVALARACAEAWTAAPIIGGAAAGGPVRSIANPADNAQTVGEVIEADAEDVDRAFDIATAAQPAWDLTPAARRADALE